MTLDVGITLGLALAILFGSITVIVIVVVKVFRKIRRNLDEWAKKSLPKPVEPPVASPVEPAPFVVIKPAEFWRLEEDRAYAEAVEKSQGLRIAPSDSPEVKERKKAQRVAIWTEHDAKKAQILREEVYQRGVKIGLDFFRDMEANPLAIGWTWDVCSADNNCGFCLGLEGSYRKGVRIPYPAHIGCRCSLSVVYKGDLDIDSLRQHKAQEGSP
jgi:hypothetical protein